jgi:hypothetical protein
MEVRIANSIIPIAGGNFRKRLLIKENRAESTMSTEKVKYKSIPGCYELPRYKNQIWSIIFLL